MKKLLFLSLFLFTSCSENQSIVNNVDERDANEIIVFLASKGIEAVKIKAVSTGIGAEVQELWNINVPPDKSVQAMSILNYNGLPRKKSPRLLEIFKKEGLMTSDREETIRYQSGMEEELKNTIRKIDGVIDVEVQISFPQGETPLGSAPPKMKAAVYVKHQGILDDPNNHLESKIKRIVAGSVSGLEYDAVTVISDLSRFTDILLSPQGEKIGKEAKEREFVKIWNVVMTKTSASHFRSLFFLFLGLILFFGAVIGFLIYKFYPHMRKK